MARLGLDVELSLVEEFPVRGAADATTRLVAPDDVGEAANEISSRILGHDLTCARSLASVDRMASALRDRSLTPLDVEIELLPILMAAGNRGEEAVALLEAYVRPGSEDASDGEYRQFARRLQRYVLHGETA